jgi:hypothetical protein
MHFAIVQISNLVKTLSGVIAPKLSRRSSSHDQAPRSVLSFSRIRLSTEPSAATGSHIVERRPISITTDTRASQHSSNLDFGGERLRVDVEVQRGKRRLLPIVNCIVSFSIPLLVSLSVCLTAFAAPIVNKHGTGGGTIKQTCPTTPGVTGCIFGVRVSDSAGLPIEVTDKDGKSFRDGVIPPFPKFSELLAPGGMVTFEIPSFVDVRDPLGGSKKESVEDILNISDVYRSPSSRADLMIEAVAFDPTANVFFVNNIFSVIAERLGIGAGVKIPDLFADTNGNGTIGEGDVLYSLVDLYEYLEFVPDFAMGDTFDIVNGMVSGLPGMMFSTTPFSFDENSGFNSGTPFSGVGHADTLHDIAAVPEPPLLGLVGAISLVLLVLSQVRKGTSPTRRLG